MIIIRNNIIPFKGYKLLNFFGLIFARGNANITKEDLNHEKIHTAQMKEMLYVPFYLWYIIEYLIISIKNINKSQNDRYHDISFEEEAYAHQNDLEYLNNRRHYEWLKYLKIGSHKK